MPESAPVEAGPVRRTVRLALPSDTAPGPWRGAVEWQTEPGWATSWRLPSTIELRDALRRAAESSTGVRAEFTTDATALTLPVRVTDTAKRVVDVLVDGELVHRSALVEGASGVTTRLPGEAANVEVWLPQDGRVSVGVIELSGASVVDLDRPPRPRWFAYGSSITHCLASSGPSETWPSMVARRNGWDLTCLGFNGQAMLDLPVAHTIAAAAPDLVTLCVGINIFNKGLMSRAELGARLHEFVTIARSGGAVGRIAVMSPIASPSRERTPNDTGMTLVEVRELLAETVEHLAEGVEYVHGLDVFGADNAALLSDGLHPDAAGYRLMGERLAPLLADWAVQ